jgi:hypothetical protein
MGRIGGDPVKAALALGVLAASFRCEALPGAAAPRAMSAEGAPMEWRASRACRRRPTVSS